jgi:hypothetical protein
VARVSQYVSTGTHGESVRPRDWFARCEAPDGDVTAELHLWRATLFERTGASFLSNQPHHFDDSHGALTIFVRRPAARAGQCLQLKRSGHARSRRIAVD